MWPIWLHDSSNILCRKVGHAGDAAFSRADQLGARLVSVRRAIAQNAARVVSGETAPAMRDGSGTAPRTFI